MNSKQRNRTMIKAYGNLWICRRRRRKMNKNHSMLCNLLARQLSFRPILGRLASLCLSLALGLGMALSMLWLSWQAAPVYANPDIRYVAPTGSDSGVCTDSANPCRTVQYAVDQADAGDEIRVAAGAYTDTIARTPPPGYPNPPASGVITQVVHISQTLTVRGGYTTTNWATSYPLTQSTTLDAESGKRVLFIGGTITVTLENLRITGGDAAGLGGSGDGISLPFHDGGGGVYVITATVTLSGNAIYSNTAGSGGGVALAGSDSATLNGNDIYSNTATYGEDGGGGGGVALGQSDDATLSGNAIHNNAAYDGGGVALGQSNNATLSDNDVYSNTADHDGGGIALAYSNDVTLSGNDIYSNTAPNNDGGGVEVYESSGVTLSGNGIYGNMAGNNGGGVELDNSGATLSGNSIYSNTAVVNGGGVYVWESNGATLSANSVYSNTARLGGGVEVYDSDDATLSSNTICNNMANIYGGGVQLAYSDDATLDNNVIADNQTGWFGSGVMVSASTANLRHNTIARNTGGNGSGVYVTDDSDFPPVYSTVALTNTILVSHTVGINVTAGSTATLTDTLWGSGAWANDADWGGDGAIVTGTLNWKGDPAFVNPAAWDYHIQTTSAALDAGLFAGVTDDVDGDARPTNSARPDAPDLGYDENKQLTVQRAVTNTMTFGAACARLVFTNTGGLSAITITVVPGQFPTNNPSDQVISRTVTITPSSSVVVSATLALCYEDDEVGGGMNEEDLQLYRWTGSAWQGYPSTVDTTNNVVTGTGVSAFSRWLSGNRDNPPTVVTLASFTARPAGGGNGFVLPLALAAMGAVGGVLFLWARRRLPERRTYVE